MSAHPLVYMPPMSQMESLSLPERFSWIAGEFVVMIPTDGANIYYPRATANAIRGLLAQAPGGIQDHKPDEFYLAQLVHYGLTFNYQAGFAKRALEVAVERDLLEVPDHLRLLKNQLQEVYQEYKAATKQFMPRKLELDLPVGNGAGNEDGADAWDVSPHNIEQAPIAGKDQASDGVEAPNGVEEGASNSDVGEASEDEWGLRAVTTYLRQEAERRAEAEMSEDERNMYPWSATSPSLPPTPEDPGSSFPCYAPTTPRRIQAHLEHWKSPAIRHSPQTPVYGSSVNPPNLDPLALENDPFIENFVVPAGVPRPRSTLRLETVMQGPAQNYVKSARMTRRRKANELASPAAKRGVRLSVKREREESPAMETGQTGLQSSKKRKCRQR